MNLISEDYLMHHGVKGMKWGVRHDPERLNAGKGDSSVTRRVKNDYNNMSDQQFRAKYQTSKHTYAKRVAKYGDPYTHRKNSTSYKVLNKMFGKNSKYYNSNLAKKQRENLVKKLDPEKQKKNRQTAKKVAIAAGSAAAVAAGIAVYKNRTVKSLDKALEQSIKDNVAKRTSALSNAALQDAINKAAQEVSVKTKGNTTVIDFCVDLANTLDDHPKRNSW